MNPQNHQLTVRLEKEVLSEFIAYSRIHGTTMSEIIRGLINEMLENEANTKKESQLH
jgi:hypothetical protein